MNRSEESTVDRALALAFSAWLAATTCFAAVSGLLFLLKGRAFFATLIQQGPYSLTPLTLTAVTLVWLSLGISAALFRRPAFRLRHGTMALCTLVAVALYTNVFRERISYGDFVDYIRAAHNLVDKVPFHSRYLYPPFAATVLGILLPFGDAAIGYICWTANILSLGAFSLLLPYSLIRYGFSRRLSPLLALLFILVNAPVLRTLGYLQVNLHAANLILISLLAYPRRPVLSALALALAVHLKASPLILALPFLMNRDWRWTALFAGMLAVIAGATMLPYGWRPFSGFLHNIQNVYEANPITFRETSVDSFFRSFATISGISVSGLTWPIVAAKVCIAAGAVVVLSRVLRIGAFVRKDDAASTVYNSFPVVLILMLLLSPLVWEHHPVLVALPYLLVLKRLNTPAEWVLYGFAYILAYLMPTFDFFPWSFGRLLSPLLLLMIISRTSGREEDGPLWRVVAAPRGPS